MELKGHKLEIGIAILCVLLITGLFRVFGSFFSGPRIEIGNISYEMPRPKSDIVGEFGLGDREIDRRYNNPFDKKGKADERKPLAANVKQAAPVKAVRQAAGQWMAVRHPQHNVRVIDRAARKGLGDSGSGHHGAYQAMAGQQQGQPTAGGTNEEQKNKITAEQWIALLNAQPTQENMRKFAAAYSAGDVDSQTFYSVIDGMLDKQNQDQQLLAIYGLGLVPEAKGFSTVARRMDSWSEGNVKTQGSAFLYSFRVPTRHTSLATALKSNDGAVAYYASEVFFEALSGQDTTNPNPRPGRGDNTVASSSYSQFLPIFQELQNSSENRVREMANRILGLLQQAQA
ncbi:MAG TPA: hypothetical protein PL182_01740 [Pseudobdellovibrionaceae bacterium]|nr:hypothetical protein [Pseudobdellovibrionaceae bacterium]